jgi:hypothetical protein
MGVPTLAPFGGAIVASSIANIQKMGAKFLMCNNAFGAWCAELEVRGKGTAAALQKELGANLLPGVTIVPAMVIAIDQAQAAGIATTVNKRGLHAETCGQRRPLMLGPLPWQAPSTAR